MKKKIRVGLIIGPIIIIIAELILIDYADLISYKNLGSFIVIMAMICMIISLIIQIRYDKKQHAKLSDNSR